MFDQTDAHISSGSDDETFADVYNADNSQHSSRWINHLTTEENDIDIMIKQTKIHKLKRVSDSPFVIPEEGIDGYEVTTIYSNDEYNHHDAESSTILHPLNNDDNADNIESDEDEDDHVDEIVINLPLLPTVDSSSELTTIKYTELVSTLMSALSSISRFATRNYMHYFCNPLKMFNENNSHIGFESMEPKEDNIKYDPIETIEYAYNSMLIYMLTNSQNPLFTEIKHFVIDNEDVIRKFCLRSHVFWEVCKLHLTLASIPKVLSKSPTVEQEISNKNKNNNNNCNNTTSLSPNSESVDDKRERLKEVLLEWNSPLTIPSITSSSYIPSRLYRLKPNLYHQLFDVFGGKGLSLIQHFETFKYHFNSYSSSSLIDDDIQMKELQESDILIESRVHPLEMSQRELNQSFFQLSKKWKTIDYTETLSMYVKALLTALCLQFCFSSTREEMDDTELRQCLTQNVLNNNNGKNTNNRHHNNNNSKNQRNAVYGPNLNFLIMSQIRYYHFMGDLWNYESKTKRDLIAALDDYKRKIIHNALYSSQKKVKENYGRRRRYKYQNQSNYTNGKNYSSSPSSSIYIHDIEEWLSEDIIERFSLECCDRISPEQRENTGQRLIFTKFSGADKDWAMFLKPVELSSFADDYICRYFRGPSYSFILNDIKRSYHEIYQNDGKDSSMVGFYEWCVLKNVSRLFIPDLDMFLKVIVHREEVFGHYLFMFSYQKPLIVQFFSRYQVYYRGEIYVINEEYNCQPGDKIEKDKYIYKTLMLYICIILQDFPKSKKAKAIVNALKDKYSEYKVQDYNETMSNNNIQQKTYSSSSTITEESIKDASNITADPSTLYYSIKTKDQNFVNASEKTTNYCFF